MEDMENIDHLFKDLGSYTEAPPPAVWDKLEQRLKKEPKRRAFPFGWWYLCMISFVVLFGAIGISMMTAKHPAATTAAAPGINTGSEATSATPAPVRTTAGSKADNNIATQPSGNKGTSATPEATTSRPANRHTGRHNDIAATEAKHTRMHHVPAIEEQPVEQADQPSAYEHSEYSTADNHTYYVSNSVYAYEDDNSTDANTATSDAQQEVEYEEREGTGGYVIRKVKRSELPEIASAPKPAPAPRYAVHRTSVNEQPSAAERTVPAIRRSIATRPIAKTQKNVHELAASTPVVKNTIAAHSIAQQHKKAGQEKPVSDNGPIKGNSITKAETLPALPIAAASGPSAINKVSAPTVKETVIPGRTAVTKVPSAEKVTVSKPSGVSVAAVPVAIPADGEPAQQKGQPATKANNRKNGSPIAQAVTAKVVPASAPAIAAVSDRKETPAGNKKTSAKGSVTQTKVAATPLAAVAHDKEGTSVSNKKTDIKSTTKQPKAAVTSLTAASNKEVTPPGNRKASAKGAPKQPKIIAAATPAAVPVQPAVAKGRPAKKVKAPLLAAKPAKASAAGKPVTAAKLMHKAQTQAEDEEETVAAAPVLAAAAKTEEPAQAKVKEPAAIAAAPKQATPADTAAAPAVVADDTSMQKHSRFSFGIKGGYEGSISRSAANKMAVMPYLEYKISDKFSLLVQPAIKGAGIRKQGVGGSQSYYSINPDGNTSITADSSIMFIISPTGFDSAMMRNYKYTQTHDSIVKSYRIGGTYVEFELPLLLKYNLTDKLSVYGGLNMVFSKLVGIKETTYNSGPILRTAVAPTITPIHQQPNEPMPLSSVLQYSGTSIANYTGPVFPTQTGSSLRFGYMLGFSYEFKKRWMADILMQQSFVKPYQQGGYDVNKALALPYFRLTLGYRLKK